MFFLAPLVAVPAAVAASVGTAGTALFAAGSAVVGAVSGISATTAIVGATVATTAIQIGTSAASADANKKQTEKQAKDQQLRPAAGTVEHYHLLEWLNFISAEMNQIVCDRISSFFSAGNTDSLHFAVSRATCKLAT